MVITNLLHAESIITVGDTMLDAFLSDVKFSQDSQKLKNLFAQLYIWLNSVIAVVELI